METTKTISGDTLIVAPMGRLDTNTAPQFQEDTAAALNGMGSVVLDLSNLEYISSAGVRAILFLQKQCNKTGAQMTLRDCNDVVMDVLKITGLDKVLKFDSSKKDN